MSDRSQLHTLVDRIPSEDLAAVEKVLRAFADDSAALRALRDAPLDSEPLSEHEREALAEYEAARVRGERSRLIHPNDLLKEFGIEDATK